MLPRSNRRRSRSASRSRRPRAPRAPPLLGASRSAPRGVKFKPTLQNEIKNFKKSSLKKATTRSGKSSGLGKAIGNLIEPGIGGMLGNAAENIFTSIIGEGDYAEVESKVPIVNNTVMGVQTPEAAQIPLMHKDKGCTRVTHREYIRDVPMTTGFGISSFLINPTNSTLFPWLALMSETYQQYKILGMVFEFKSLAANAVSGPNAGMGSVTLSADYDVYSVAPITKSQANNAMFAVSCKPSENMLFPIECDPEMSIAQPLYITNNSLANPQPDHHFYDFARLDVITQGASAAYPGAGELWVTYDILLLKPVVRTTPKSMALHLQLAADNDAAPLALLSGSAPVYNTFPPGLGSITLTTTSITLPYLLDPGSVIGVFFGFTGGATAGLVTPAITTANGLAGDFTLAGDSETAYIVPAATSSTTSSFQYLVYDGTGTALLPPTISYVGGDTVFPTTALGGGDFIVINFGVGFL